MTLPPERIKWRRTSNGGYSAHIAVCGCGIIHNCEGLMLRCQVCRDKGIKCGDSAGYFPVIELYTEEWDGVVW